MLFYTAAIILSVFGCSYFSDYATIRIDLEETRFPWDDFIPGPEHRVLYPNPEDPSRKTELILKPWQRSAGIRICKGSAVPVAVYSLAGGKPSGGIFPHDLRDGMILMISPEQGFLAELLLSILPERTRVEALNISRLRDVIAEKCEGDPWSIDMELLKTSIILGSMAEYRVRRMETEIFEIEGLPGLWVPDSLFRDDIPSGEDGLLSLNLYPGVSGFLNPETGRLLYVSVKEGTVEYMIAE